MADPSQQIASPASRVALRGWDSNGNTVFEVLRQGAALVFTPAAPNFQQTRLLIFLDPDAATEAWLFVLPVLNNTFSADTSTPGTAVLKGRIRSFLPEFPSGFATFHDGWHDFELRIDANTSGTAILRFRHMRIGDAEADFVQCQKLGLLAAQLVGPKSGIDLTIPGYIATGLLNIARASAADVQKMTWWAFARFIAAPDASVPVALAIERQTQLPIDAGAQSIAPFGLTFQGSDLMVRSTPTAQVRYMWIWQRLPWNAQWNQTGVTQNWLVRLSVPQTSVLAAWNSSVVEPVAAAVALVDAGRPLTTLPILSGADTEPPDTPFLWDAWFTFIDQSDNSQLKTADYHPWGNALVSGAVTILPRQVSPSADETLRVTAAFQSIVRLDDQSLSATFFSKPLAFDEFATASQTQGFAFDLEQTKPTMTAPAPQPQPVRMGSLDLQFLPEAALTPTPTNPWVPTIDGMSQSGLAGTCRAWWGTQPGNTFAPSGIIGRSVQMSLGVSAIAPGGQDDIPGEEYVEDVRAAQDTPDVALLLGSRSRPLMFNVDPSASDPWTAVYRLEMLETIERARTQTITFNLFQTGQPQSNGSPTTRVLVFDNEPWFVGLVEAPLLGAQDPDLTTEVANWTNRADLGANWQVQTSTTGFLLQFPPQGMGEAMHRRIEDGDITPLQPIDFRLTPIAELTLEQTTNPQRFAEPGWNVRRVTESASGAGVASATFELLYGMFGTLTTTGLRLSEITARIGTFPGVAADTLPWQASVAQKNVYSRVRNMWAALLGALHTRMAVYEPWIADRDPLLLTDADGLSFTLRDTARLAYPVSGTPEPLPNGGSIPPYFAGDLSHGGGLKGGWSWGFESRNILDAVGRTPDSFAASLSQFYLSSLGAWGQQRASFDRGLSTIISRVEMGRASMITIERIGRIGIFWNRAKHVIVYERTVAATRQFFEEQYPLVGNPVLRKVEEYVELLEVERAFPEASTPPANRGFVTSCRFTGAPPRIHVDSRWGHDIGDTGWKIPLWLRGAHPPDVYPMPAIYLMNEGITGETVPIVLDDPDKLFFYTSTDPTLKADTDSWPAVDGVDFQTVDETWLTKPAARGVTTDPATYKAQDSPIKAELEAFTLRLQPPPAPVNYVAARTDQVVRAIPRTVTMMRGGNIAKGVASPPPEAQLKTQVQNLFSNFVTATSANPAQSFDNAIKDFRDGFTKAITGPNTGPNTGLLGTVVGLVQDPNVCQSIRSRFNSQLNQFAQQTKLEATAALQVMEQNFRTVATPLFAGATDLTSLKTSLGNALTSVASDAGGATQLIRTARGMPGEALAKLDVLASDLRALNSTVDAAFANAYANLGALPDWTAPGNSGAVQQAAAILDQFTSDAVDFLTRGAVDYRIGEAANLLMGTLPNSGRITLDSGRSACAAAVNSIQTSLSTTAQATALNKLQAAADDAFTAILGLIDLLEGSWTDIFTGDPENPWPLETALDQLQSAIGTYVNTLSAIDVNAFSNGLDVAMAAFYGGLDAQLDTLIQSTVSAAAGPVSDLVGNACSSILANVGVLTKYLNQVISPDNLAALENLAKSAVPSEFFQAVDGALTTMLDDVGTLISRVQIQLPSVSLTPSAAGDGLLRLFRSFGDAPALPNLQFDLPQIGYYFFKASNLAGSLPSLLPQIDLSPVKAAANQLAGDVLNGLNISVPADKLLDNLIPTALENFDLSKIFPNIGGLSLDGLFQSIRMPSTSTDQVKVTQGIDQATRSGWLQVDANVPYDGTPLPVFNIAGVSLTLLNARFVATARVDAVLGQQPTEHISGSISGNWALNAGGFALAQFNDAVLRFDDGGHIAFNISPANVQLGAPLDFLSDILAPFDGSDSGFHLAVTPTGIQTTLFLPVPDVQAGTFGIANLVFGFLFGLDIIPKFRIRTALMVGKPEWPFTLSVFILGGAGYLSTALTYIPADKDLAMDLTIGIFASASLAISFGFLSGGIYAYFGIEVDFHTSTVSGSNLTIVLKIIFDGEVDVLGFITIGLTLGLSASYDSDHNLTGEGFVSISISIGWFISINISASVSYTFGKGTTTTSQSSIQASAGDYTDMF